MAQFEYAEARNLEELSGLLEGQGERGVVLAGGTDLLDRLKEGLVQPERVINIKPVRELRGIKREKGLDIGALTPIAELAADEGVHWDYPVLAQAAGGIATPQLRNMGTLGGNLCQRPRCWYFRGREYPCLKKGGHHCYAFGGLNQNHAIMGGGPCFIVHPSDSAPALIALGASLEIFSPRGKRQVRVEDFFQRPSQNLLGENLLQSDEVIARIRVPAPAAGARSVYLKFRHKQSLDFALGSVAAVVVVKGGRVEAARVVLGGVAPIPWRVREAEAQLEGQALSEGVIRQAAEAAVKGARSLQQNGYKVRLVQNLVRRALEGLAGV